MNISVSASLSSLDTNYSLKHTTNRDTLSNIREKSKKEKSTE